MKKIGIIMTFVAAIAFVSCGSMGGTVANTQAKADGLSCANALKALKNSKQANGTISITNSVDLANMLVVLNSYNQLKANKENSTYKTQFVSGLIAAGLTTENANAMLNALLSNTALANINASNIQQKAETISAILMLINALK
jgi:hypothetical protein